MAEMTKEGVAEKETAAEQQCLVAEFKLHNMPKWVQQIIERLRVLSSVCVAQTLAELSRGLEFVKDSEGKVERVILNLTLADEFRERIEKLLDPTRERKNPNARVTNSYGFIGIQDGEVPGTISVHVRLLEIVEVDGKKRKETIAVTQGLQQLISSFIRPRLLMLLPKELRDGVSQEIGQQLMSHVNLEVGGKVAEANFPTVESRDPQLRQAHYQTSLLAAARRTEPFPRKTYPELYPERWVRILKEGDQATIEKLQNRQLIVDPDWDAVRHTPVPDLFHLLFVTSGAVQVFCGEKRVEAGVSKADMCRGIDKVADSSGRVQKPAKVEAKGFTAIRPYYVALPLISPEDEEIRAIVDARNQKVQEQKHQQAGKSGRGWDFNLVSLPVWGSEPYRACRGRRQTGTQRVLVPLEFGAEQKIAVFDNRGIEICWSRLVVKGRGSRKDYYWQLTYKVGPERILPVQNVLGIHLGINNIVTWVVVDKISQMVAKGQFKGNPQLAEHLSQMAGISWDQKKGRWVGGRGYSRKLRTITFELVHRMIRLAIGNNAMIAIENIKWVEKRKGTRQENQRFSGWNYGTLRRILGYKVPLAGLGSPWFTSQYIIDLTCPQCGAIKRKGQKRDNADTWLDRKAGVLECRKCGLKQAVTPEQKALLVACSALPALRARNGGK